MKTVESRLHNASPILKSCPSFSFKKGNDDIMVTDPWGSIFRLIVDSNSNDDRGSQPGDKSLCVAMSDLCVHIPNDANIDGIGRFYKHVFNTPIITNTDTDSVQIVTSPKQTLTFKKISNSNSKKIDHSDIRKEESGLEGNHGPHISMYINDFTGSFHRADALGSLFVNYRFKRQATNLDEAIDQCMFRCLNVIDPDNIKDGPIIRLEHEVRSYITKDNKLYKSCPFYELPK